MENDNKKRIGVRKSNFRNLVEKDCYLVDKTKLIEDIIKDNSDVILFTRPRKFGKTLNMTMFDEFFGVRKYSKKLFKGTYISNTNYMKSHLNNFPTIFLSFKNCKGTETDTIINKVCNVLETAIEQIIENTSYSIVNDTLKNKINRVYSMIYNRDFSNMPIIFGALELLLQAHYQMYGKKVILLIDDYDTPIQSAFDNNIHKEITEFFTGIYENVLKDNEYLEKCILTGIQEISKESIFSGSNGLKVNTVLDTQYNSCFGFTEEETNNILEYYDLDLDDDVEEMYNGYNFCGCRIYNPESIINYCETKKLKNYWTNSLNNQLILKLLKQDKIIESFLELFYNNKIETRINLNINYVENIKSDAFFGLLLNYGYVTLEKSLDEISLEERVTIMLVNEEVKYDLDKLLCEVSGENETDKPYVLLFRDFINRRILNQN